MASSNLSSSSVLITDTNLLQDPLADLMRPFESFVYSLGLELVESNFNSHNDKDNDLRKDSFNLSKLRVQPFNDLKLMKCKNCDFQTESQIVMDQHLSQPHRVLDDQNHWKIVCNFCQSTTLFSQPDYRKHMLKAHGQNIAKTFKEDELKKSSMCSICDFECPASLSRVERKEKMIEHSKFQCSFRESNLQMTLAAAFLENSQTSRKPGPFVDFKYILDHCQTPHLLDHLYYEFCFGVKPLDSLVDNFDLFKPPESIFFLKKEYLEEIGALKLMQTLLGRTDLKNNEQSFLFSDSRDVNCMVEPVHRKSVSLAKIKIP
jgi:hypothetical protein